MFAVSIADAVLVVALIVFLLRRNASRCAAIFVGERPVWREAPSASPWCPLVTLGVAATVARGGLLCRAAQRSTNPMGALMRDPSWR